MNYARAIYTLETLLGKSALIISVWGFATVGGFAVLWDHEFRAGNTVRVANHFPSSEVPRSSSHYTILVFIHPHCPCTKASLRELERIDGVVHEQSELRFVVCCKDVEINADELRNQLLNRFSGSVISFDRTGNLVKQFGVSTSGHVLVYDAEGVLRFSGGITASRGHEGTNLGRESVLAIVTGKSRQNFDHPVFGCALPSAEEGSR